MEKKTGQPKTRTYRRYLVIKGCRHDWGFGPGVIARDQATYTDAGGQGFDSPLFLLARREDAISMMLESVTVLMDSPPGKTWSKNPQAEAKASKKKHKNKK